MVKKTPLTFLQQMVKKTALTFWQQMVKKHQIINNGLKSCQSHNEIIARETDNLFGVA